MSRAKHRESATVRRIRPANSLFGTSAERRGPRPWTRGERDHFLHHLASTATLTEALAAAHVDRGDAWAERARNAEFARAWDRCLADRIIRLPELLMEQAVTGLAGGTEPGVRQAASIGQWLVEKCLPLVTRHAAAADRPAATPEGSSVAAPQDAMAIDRALGQQIASIRQRLAEAAATDTAENEADPPV